MKVDVTAHVTVFDYDEGNEGYELEQQIVSKAAKEVGRQYADRIEHEMAARIQELVSAEIATVMGSVFTPMGPYGEPKGEPTTMREMIAQTAHEFFTKKISKEGRPAAFARSGEKTLTAIEWLAYDAATNVLADATKAAQEELRQQVRDGMAATIADVATKALGLK